jgi:hypothetical protein
MVKASETALRADRELIQWKLVLIVGVQASTEG